MAPGAASQDDPSCLARVPTDSKGQVFREHLGKRWGAKSEERNTENFHIDTLISF